MIVMCFIHFDGLKCGCDVLGRGCDEFDVATMWLQWGCDVVTMILMSCNVDAIWLQFG